MRRLKEASQLFNMADYINKGTDDYVFHVFGDSNLSYRTSSNVHTWEYGKYYNINCTARVYVNSKGTESTVAFVLPTEFARYLGLGEARFGMSGSGASRTLYDQDSETRPYHEVFSKNRYYDANHWVSAGDLFHNAGTIGYVNCYFRNGSIVNDHAVRIRLPEYTTFVSKRQDIGDKTTYVWCLQCQFIDNFNTRDLAYSASDVCMMEFNITIDLTKYEELLNLKHREHLLIDQATMTEGICLEKKATWSATADEVGDVVGSISPEIFTWYFNDDSYSILFDSVDVLTDNVELPLGKIWATIDEINEEGPLIVELGLDDRKEYYAIGEGVDDLLPIDPNLTANAIDFYVHSYWGEPYEDWTQYDESHKIGDFSKWE